MTASAVTGHRILYLQYGNPAAYPPLERSAAQFADAGWDVLFVGAHTAGVEFVQLAPRPRTRAVLLAAAPRGWRLKRHYLWFCVWASWHAVRYRPRCIYASDVLAAPVALFLKTVFGQRVVYHEHDAYDPAQATAFMRLCLAASRRLSRVSDLNVLPSDGRVEHFIAQNAVPRETCARVWNCPNLSEVQPPRTATPRDGLTLLFQGSIVPARLPLAVLHAMAALGDVVTLRVIGYETMDNRGYIDRLKAEAARLHLSGRIEFLQATHHDDLLALSEPCDVGLALMPLETTDVNMRSMAGASNKAFEYLACGLPLIVSDRPEWRAMFVDAGYARSCDPENPDSIADALRWFLHDPDRARAIGEAGRQRILADWNYERAFAPVFRSIAGAPGPSAGR
jgi:glycosyltransferase involved in cell wall biosynthesis